MNSAQVSGYYKMRFSLPSIIIMATANEPWQTEANKMDQNLPITTDKRDLFTQLKRTSISWEFCLDDWRQQNIFHGSFDLNRVRMFLEIPISIRLYDLSELVWMPKIIVHLLLISFSESLLLLISDRQEWVLWEQDRFKNRTSCCTSVRRSEMAGHNF